VHTYEPICSFIVGGGNMLFSIIVPTYNSEKTIRNCISSILTQSFTNFEVILINDGSTDNTLEILEEYAKKDSRIKVYSFENAGVSVSRQRGINLASGQYFIFVDSDDSINSELLYELSLTVNTYPSADLIRYQSCLLEDAPNKNHERYNFYDSVNVPLSGMDALKLWSKPGIKYAVYWIFAFGRNLFAHLSFPTNLRCYEDVALIPLLVASASTVVTIDYIGYNYTFNNQLSLTHTKNYDAEKSRVQDFHAACEYAVENFKLLDNVTNEDIAFFEKDYQRRLGGKYDSSSNKVKEELAHLYGS
jgi:glycosyltransferase involved in cell wall biosynthesis